MIVGRPRLAKQPEKWRQPRAWRTALPKTLLIAARAFVIGAAFVSVQGIPGLTSAFVAIYVSVLAYDLMVAAPSIKPRRAGFAEMVSALRNTLGATLASLAKGLSLGILFGALTLVGFPPTVGAILTAGLGFSWSAVSRSGFTDFVAILGGLAVFERIRDVTRADGLVQIVQGVLPAATESITGTLLALGAGWSVGLIVGITLRAFLTRPYRTRLSSAYEPQVEDRSFGSVVHIGRRYQLVDLVVDEDSPLAGKSLADTGLRNEFGATVVILTRNREEIVMPSGRQEVLAGDRLVVLSPMGQRERIVEALGVVSN